mmetsp:Transcript_7351/g.15135  ORF Transcript_7351/g.15135 Transcript_7351/m.15135 type:complete len:491 (-) Transcript_7351:195-1667(-)
MLPVFVLLGGTVRKVQTTDPSKGTCSRHSIVLGAMSVPVPVPVSIKPRREPVEPAAAARDSSFVVPRKRAEGVVAEAAAAAEPIPFPSVAFANATVAQKGIAPRRSRSSDVIAEEAGEAIIVISSFWCRCRCRCRCRFGRCCLLVRVGPVDQELGKPQVQKNVPCQVESRLGQGIEVARVEQERRRVSDDSHPVERPDDQVNDEKDAQLCGRYTSPPPGAVVFAPSSSGTTGGRGGTASAVAFLDGPRRAPLGLGVFESRLQQLGVEVGAVGTPVQQRHGPDAFFPQCSFQHAQGVVVAIDDQERPRRRGIVVVVVAALRRQHHLPEQEPPHLPDVEPDEALQYRQGQFREGARVVGFRRFREFRVRPLRRSALQQAGPIQQHDRELRSGNGHPEDRAQRKGQAPPRQEEVREEPPLPGVLVGIIEGRRTDHECRDRLRGGRRRLRGRQLPERGGGVAVAVVVVVVVVVVPGVAVIQQQNEWECTGAEDR